MKGKDFHAKSIFVYLHFLSPADTQVKPGFVIKKGWKVEMPIYSCHHNERVFPEPDKFKPERFNRENLSKLNPFLFRAFGGG